MLHILVLNAVCKDVKDVMDVMDAQVLQQGEPLQKGEVSRCELQCCNAYTAHTQQGDALIHKKCETTLPDVRQQRD